MNYQTGEKKTSTVSEHAHPLIRYIEQIHPLNDEIKDFVSQNCTRKKFRRGQYLLKEGEICQNYYFIHKGILRSFLKFGSREITVWINPENELTTSIKSMSRSMPSEEYIQAIEDCDLIVIPFGVMAELYERFPEMNRVGRMLLEEYYAESEERVYICRIPSAALRYQHFIDSRPELANRIPLKFIASYLGMTIETLSRLRAKRTVKKQ